MEPLSCHSNQTKGPIFINKRAMRPHIAHLECKKVLEKDEVYELGCSNYVNAVKRVRTAIMQASDLLFNYS